MAGYSLSLPRSVTGYSLLTGGLANARFKVDGTWEMVDGLDHCSVLVRVHHRVPDRRLGVEAMNGQAFAFYRWMMTYVMERGWCPEVGERHGWQCAFCRQLWRSHQGIPNER
jgi:hypothetical protein